MITPARFWMFVILVVIAFGLVACGSNSSQYSTDISPGVAHPDTAGFRVITRSELDPPTPGFNFELVNQNNDIIRLEDFRGQVVMITFIYTHCPEACPLVAANFRTVQNELIDEVNQGNLAQVLITTDPARDTPERLLRYTHAFDAQWDFLTSDLETLKEVWDSYDIYWEIKERTKEVVVFHSYKTYLIDKEGFIRYEFVGVWYPGNIIPDVLQLIAE
jgi:protein SCO1/2